MIRSARDTKIIFCMRAAQAAAAAAALRHEICRQDYFARNSSEYKNRAILFNPADD